MAFLQILLLLGLLTAYGDAGPGIDPIGFRATADEGNGFDPHGSPRATSDEGPGIDPDGGRAASRSDEGWLIDPNG